MASLSHSPLAAAIVAAALGLWTAGCAGDSGSAAGSASDSDSGDSDSGGDASSSGSTSAGDSDSGGTSTGDSDSGGTGDSTGEACELDLEVDVLRDLVIDLGAVTETVRGGAGTLQPAGFLVAPGYSADKAVIYAAALTEACGDAAALDPGCDAGRCWQVACTGVAGEWSVTTWLESVPAQAGDFTFSDLSAALTFSDDSAEFTFQITSKATKGPATWGVSANGQITAGGFTVVALLPELFGGHETVLIAASEGEGFSGELEINGVSVATVGADGNLTPTGACY